jgi:hypothetical protein
MVGNAKKITDRSANSFFITMILFLTRLTPKKLMSVGVNQKYKKMKHVNYFTVLFYGNS